MSAGYRIGVLADAAPTAVDGVMAALSAMFTLRFIAQARRLWRGPHRVLDGARGPSAPFGPASWHGFTRRLPLIAAFCGAVRGRRAYRP